MATNDLLEPIDLDLVKNLLSQGAFLRYNSARWEFTLGQADGEFKLQLACTRNGRTIVGANLFDDYLDALLAFETAMAK